MLIMTRAAVAPRQNIVGKKFQRSDQGENLKLAHLALGSLGVAHYENHFIFYIGFYK